MTKRVLLTGAGGFVGSHILRHLLTNTDWELVCPVTFRHRGNQDRIASSVQDRPEWQARVHLVMCDLSSPISRTIMSRLGRCDIVMNVASESHVDRSIEDPVGFIQNNTSLMLNVLEYCREVRPGLILQMSTDEVYGPAAADHAHREWETPRPSNPYSASKAAQEAICYAYWRTYGLPIIITNTMNIIGEMQDREKFFIKTLRALVRSESVTVHAAPRLGGRLGWTPGSRFYLHARNLADAWLFLANTFTGEGDYRVGYEDGLTEPQRFHIVGEREVTNTEMVEMIAVAVGLAGHDVKIEYVDFHSSRPGHDLRYALDGTRIADLGWKAPLTLQQSLLRTVEWTLNHPEWLE